MNSNNAEAGGVWKFVSLVESDVGRVRVEPTRAPCSRLPLADTRQGIRPRHFTRTRVFSLILTSRHATPGPETCPVSIGVAKMDSCLRSQMTTS